MFTFDKEKHEYKADGIVIPSVTQVLVDNGLSDFSMIPHENLERARNKGEAYHLATEYEDKGVLDYETLSTPLVPLLDQWKKFKEEYQVDILAIEARNYSKKYRFGYTIDRVVQINGGPTKRWIGKVAILDIKTGAIPKTVGLQTGAYKIGWNEESLTILREEGQRASKRLYFKPFEDRYIIKECDDPQDEVDFLHLLAATHIRRKIK